MILVVDGWLLALVVYVQRGYFEGAAFLTFFAEGISSSLAYHLFLAFVIPLCTIYRIPHQRIKAWMKRWSILLSGPFFAFFVALTYYSRGSIETFNWIQVGHCLFILTGNVVFCSALIFHSHKLTRVLESLSHSNMPSRRLREVQTLERRTRWMMGALILYLLLVVVTVSIIVAMVIVFGSAMFGWVIVFITAHFSIVLALGISVFLRQRRDVGDRSSLGIVVERGHQATDVPGDDYLSWTKTNTTNMQATTTRGARNGYDSGVHKGMRSGLDDSMVPITEMSDDGGNEMYRSDDAAVRVQSAKAQAYQSVVSDSDRVARRDRGVVVASSQAPPSGIQSTSTPSAVLSFHESDLAPRSRAQVISGRNFSTLSSKRGEVASSVFQSEAETTVGDRTRSSQRKKRGLQYIRSRLASQGTSKLDEEPDF